MTTGGGSAREVMRVLRERYRDGSGAIVKAFLSLADEIGRAPESPEVIEAVRREAHRVRGTAGTYGFLEASEIAATLERRCDGWARDPAVDAGMRAAVVERAAHALATSFAPLPDAEGAPGS